MNVRALLLLSIFLVAGCVGPEPAPESQAEPMAESEAEPAIKTWTVQANLTTRGATEMTIDWNQLAGGVPGGTGVYEPTDFNCAQIIVRGIHLHGLEATIDWTESGPEKRLMLYHFLKEQTGPFHGGADTRGESPLRHATDFGGENESSEWLTVGVHPATGLPAWRGMVDHVALNLTVQYSSYVEGAEPTLDKLKMCSPTHCMSDVDPFCWD